MTEVVDGLLRNMEALIIGCQGGHRPHLRALQFGGAAKLARELTSFLNSGAIHRDKHGEESCLPYLRSLYCPPNGHLLKSEWNDPKDITDWFVEMIVNATLSCALMALTSEGSKLHLHYEHNAPIICKVSLDRLIRGARCLDEMDAESLAEVQLSAITSTLKSPDTEPPTTRPIHVKLPRIRIPKSRPANQPKPNAASSLVETRLNESSRDTVAPAVKEVLAEKKKIPPKNINHSVFDSSSGQNFATTSNRLYSTSCPCLTEIGFKKFLQSRNWSLPEDETGLQSPPVLGRDTSAVSAILPEGIESEIFSNLGARPKVKLDPSIADAVAAGLQETNSKPSVISSATEQPPAKSKRRTHRRSASDTAVPSTIVKSLVSVAASQAPTKIAELNEEDFIEGYEEGPSYPTSQAFNNWKVFPPSCGSWSELRPPSGGWQFPQPAFKEQSLFNYIISGQFSKHQAPLDQDNAHLILAEAVINASSGKSLSIPSSTTTTSEASKTLRQGRSMKKQTGDRRISTWRNADSQSADNVNVEDQNGEFDDHVECQSETESTDEAGGDSSAQRKRSNTQFVLHDGSPLRERSAEATALQLLLNLKNPHLPKASELRCLVSEQDAPQKLLPLPPRFVAFSSDTSAASPDDRLETDGEPEADPDEDDLAGATELRGNLFWAPPRPQLILKIHSKQINIKTAMVDQNYFCHDCGMKVDQAFIHTFRFCFYFGKYSCTTCHSNKTHSLPANIIHKWDFKEYRVSDFALNVLQRLSTDPLFAVQDLNPNLVKRIGKLRGAIGLREQAVKVSKYLITCRFANSLTLELDEFFNVIDPGTLSLKELCSIKTGHYTKNLKKQIEVATEHVLNCELCCARGFLCEGCHSGGTLFPFQLGDVFQCEKCYACYHVKCVKNPCTKCLRLKDRR